MATTSRILLLAIPAVPIMLFAGSVVLLANNDENSHSFRLPPPSVEPAFPERHKTRLGANQEAEPPPQNPISRTATFEKGYGKSRHLAGHLWFAADEAGSQIDGSCASGDCSDGVTPEICAEGTVKQVANEAWEESWGAAIGWNIAQGFGESTASRLTSDEVKGLFFRLRNLSSEPVELRFGTRLDATEYCTTVREGENRFLWSDLRRNCWDARDAEDTAETIPISAVKWNIVTSPLRSQDFRVCIGEITELH